MNFICKALILILTILVINNCNDKITYSGIILNENNLELKNLNNKTEIINSLGKPSFIDPIEKKYYYFSEKKINKNFYNKKIAERILIVFEFDKNDLIISTNKYDLNDEKEAKLINETTENELVKRGLIEKIFGGVGNNMPTSQ